MHSVPKKFKNKGAPETAYSIDADAINEDYTSLSLGTAIEDGVIVARHIGGNVPNAQGIRDMFDVHGFLPTTLHGFARVSAFLITGGVLEPGSAVINNNWVEFTSNIVVPAFTLNATNYIYVVLRANGPLASAEAGYIETTLVAPVGGDATRLLLYTVVCGRGVDPNPSVVVDNRSSYYASFNADRLGGLVNHLTQLDKPSFSLDGSERATGNIDVAGYYSIRGVRNLSQGGVTNPLRNSLYVGYEAGAVPILNASSTYNTVVGNLAGTGGTGAVFNKGVLVGHAAGYALTTGSQNIFVGYNAGGAITDGGGNIIVGTDVLGTSHQTNTLNVGNLLIGDLTNLKLGIAGAADTVAALTVTGQVKITGGVPVGEDPNGYVLTSDTNGLAMWKAAGSTAGVAILLANQTFGGENTFTKGLIISKGVVSTAGLINSNSTDLQTLRSAPEHVASGIAAVIGGGTDNSSTGNYCVVGGGAGNLASGAGHAFVGGGSTNEASGQYSVVAGGFTNTAGGSNSAILGGSFNVASASGSIALGTNAVSTAAGSLTWADSEAVNVTNDVADRAWFKGRGGFMVTTTASSVAPALCVSSVGKVGVGTETPSVALEVSGQVKITGGVPGVGKYLACDADGLASWNVPPGGGSGGGDAVLSNTQVFSGVNTFSNITIFGDSLSSSGGDSRGSKAIDLQTVRTLTTQVASGVSSVISGGKNNTASALYSTIPGGYTNVASGTGAFAAGQLAQSTAAGTFTWADSEGTAIVNNVTDRTWFKSRGGFLITCTSNAAAPGLFVGANNYVGVGTLTPTTPLHVVGAVTVVDGGQGAGKVLTSDANGVGSWQSFTGVSLIADNTFSGINNFTGSKLTTKYGLGVGARYAEEGYGVNTEIKVWPSGATDYGTMMFEKPLAYLLSQSVEAKVCYGSAGTQAFGWRMQGSADVHTFVRVDSASPANDIWIGKSSAGVSPLDIVPLVVIKQDNKVGVGVEVPSALVHVAAGTTTVAPLKLTPGASLTIAQPGTLEFDGVHLYFTAGLEGQEATVRYQLDRQLTGSQVMVWNEVPSGAIDGSNTGYTLANAPVSEQSLQLFVNGVLQSYGEDFDRLDENITMLNALEVGDSIRATYLK